MKLSNYSKYKGESGVCITHYKPVKWVGECYTKVSPKCALMLLYKEGRISKQEYSRRYKEETLQYLNVNDVYTDLKGKVLLTPSDDGMFCFKYILAQWIEDEIGVKVEEI